MENIKVYIKQNDINNYLLKHKDDETLKYKEALFLNYLEESEYDTEEKREMLGINLDSTTYNFQDYINNLKKKHSPTVKDISLILVPSLGLNSLYAGDINIGVNYIYNYARLLDDNANIEKVIKESIYRLRNISKEYYSRYEGVDYPIREIGVLNDTLGKYAKLRHIGIINYNGSDFSLIGKDRCEKELESYASIYGFDTVEIIKEYTKELKRNEI